MRSRPPHRRHFRPPTRGQLRALAAAILVATASAPAWLPVAAVPRAATRIAGGAAACVCDMAGGAACCTLHKKAACCRTGASRAGAPGSRCSLRREPPGDAAPETTLVLPAWRAVLVVRPASPPDLDRSGPAPLPAAGAVPSWHPSPPTPPPRSFRLA